jgi:hypothetical protein
MGASVALVVEDLRIGLIGMALYALVARVDQLQDELKEFV